MTMTRDFDVFPIDKLRGIEDSSISIIPYWALDKRCYNISMGINDGYSPRFGMQPIQGHCSNVENVGPGAISYFPGLRFAENTLNINVELGANPRKGVYSVYPVTLEYQCYAWTLLRLNSATGDIGSGSYFMDVTISQEAGISGSPSPYFAAGFKQTQFPTLNRDLAFSRMVYKNNASSPLFVPSDNIRDSYITDVYVSPQKRIQMTYQFADTFAPGVSPTAAPNLNFLSRLEFADSWALDTITQERSIQIQILGTASLSVLGNAQVSFVLDQYDSVVMQNTDPTGSNYMRGRPGTAADENLGTAELTMSTVGTQTIRSAAVGGFANPSAIRFALLQDENNNISSSYTLIAVAKKNPLGMFYRPWRFDNTELALVPHTPRTYGNYIGFTNTFPFFRNTRGTVNEANTNYTENGVATYTAWNRWPNYVQGTALAQDSAITATGGQNPDGYQHVRLGPSGSGILRENTTYEITYSVYDKVLDKESNVGVPAKIQTGDVDSVALTLYRQVYGLSGGTGYSGLAQMQIGVAATAVGAVLDPILTTDGYTGYHKNAIEYRFYYRPLGAYEWRFAGSYDYAQFFLDGQSKRFYICQADAVGLPGGQPGSIYDHSDLPDEEWFDVKVFQNSLCFLSQTTFAFSTTNQPFDYPIRNRAPVPRGVYKGMIIHKYPGQAEQSARLVIFGSEATYVFRYKGQSFLEFYNLQLNDTQTVSIPLEQSDARLDFWYSSTSFSGRSAIVAEGMLYWWGPKGIFADDGVNTPVNISQDMQIGQWISSIYDRTTQSDIFCSYDKNTNEITWYFKPNSLGQFGFDIETTEQTLGLVINVKLRTFVGILKFPDNMQINWAQTVNIDSDVTTNIGERTLIGYKNSVVTDQPQRACFFDSECFTPDYPPSGDPLMFSTAVSLGSDTYRLTSVTGSPTLTVGSQVLIKDYNRYTSTSSTSDSPDAFYTVVGITGLNIDVTGTPGFSTVAFASMNDFPGYTSGQGFEFNLQNRFFAPKGLAAWFNWQYNLTNYRVELLDGNTPTVQYRFLSLLREDTSDNDRTISIVNNLNGQFQVHHAIEFQNALAQGQALAFKMFGVYYGGHKWTLQYHHFEATPDDYGNIRQFEG